MINSFEFENNRCICKKETIYSSPDANPVYIVKVCSDTSKKPLKYSYSAQKGLNLCGDAGGVIEENIIGKLLSIPTDDLDATVNFIENMGFFFQ